MRIVDFPFSNGNEISVDADAGVFTLEIKASLLGNPEDIKLNLSLKTVLMTALSAITNPVLRLAISVIINLLV